MTLSKRRLKRLSLYRRIDGIYARLEAAEERIRRWEDDPTPRHRWLASEASAAAGRMIEDLTLEIVWLEVER